MGRPQVITTAGQSRRDLPDNALGLPLEGFAARLTTSPAPTLIARGTHSAAAAERVEQFAVRLAELEIAYDPAEAADRYLDCPADERRDRIAAAVTVALLGQPNEKLLAARDGHRPAGRTARRLSELELGAVRIGTWCWPLRAVTVAIAEAGAVVGQHIAVHPRQLAQQNGRWAVALPANRGVVTRTVELQRWVNPMLGQALETARRDGHRLCLTTPPAARDRDRRNVTANLDRALAVAGADATAASIRLTTGHTAYEAGGLPTAAAALGVTSHASARRLLGLDDA